MHLSDADIQREIEAGRIDVTPLSDPAVQIQPAGVDIRLENEFLEFTEEMKESGCIDPTSEGARDAMDSVVLDDEETYVVEPGDFVLGSTVESVSLSDEFVSFVNGRSTLGRLGIMIHATAGLVDPGWDGQVTLEISNVGGVDIELTPGMRIGQLTFHRLETPADRPYGVERGSKYQGQSGVQPASTSDLEQPDF